MERTGEVPTPSSKTESASPIVKPEPSSDEAAPILNIEHFEDVDQSFAGLPSIPTTPLSFKTETQSYDALDMAKTVNIKREREGSSSPSERAAKNPKIGGSHEDELKSPSKSTSAASEASVVPSGPSVLAPDTTWVHPSRLGLVGFPTQDVLPPFMPQRSYFAVGVSPPTGPRRIQAAGSAQDFKTITMLERELYQKKQRLEAARTKVAKEQASLNEAEKARVDMKSELQAMNKARDRKNVEIKALKKERDIFQRGIQILKTRLHAANARTQEIAKGKQRLSDMSKSISDAEDEIKQLKGGNTGTEGSVWMRI